MNSKVKVFVFLIFVFFTIHQSVFAQYWELMPGSPTNVSSMTYDAKGNLWAGTDNRYVYLYDGTRWESKGRVGSTIYSIAVAPNGDIYVGDNNGGDFCGLYRSTTGGTSLYRVFTASNIIMSIVVSPSGAVYFATYGSGVYRPNGNSWTNASNGLSNRYVYSLALAPNGILYAGTYGGIYRSTNDGVTWLPSSYANADTIISLTVIDNNTLFAAASTNGILKSTDGGQNWSRCDTPISERTTYAYNIIYNSKTEELFAHIDGYTSVNYFCNFLRSTDLGQNWILQERGLPTIEMSYTNDIFAFNPITGETYLAVSRGNNFSGVYRFLTDVLNTSIVISPTNIDFGDVNVETFSQESVKITNSGTALLVISSVSIIGDAFTLSGFTTPITVPPGGSYDLTVQFSPTETIDYSGSLILAHNADGASSAVDLRGTGIISDVKVSIKGNHRVKPNETVKISVQAIDDLTNKNAKSFSFTLKYNKRILSFKDVSLIGTLSNSLVYSTKGSTPGELNITVTNSRRELLTGIGSLIDINFLGLRGDTCGTDLIFESFAFNSNGPNAITENGYCELFGGCGEPLYVTTDQSTRVYQNNPNPIQEGYESTIQYRINVAGETNLIVYDILGREVAKLVNEYKSEGIYSVTFNTKGLPSGVYFYKLRAPGYEGLKKMVVIR